MTQNGHNTNIDDYKSLIEIAVIGNTLYELDEIKKKYKAELPDTLQLELEKFELECLERTVGQKIQSKDEKLAELFIRKQKDGVRLWNESIPFGEWLSKEYIPRFHTLKLPDIQSPIAASLMLVNSNLYLRDVTGNSLTPLPNVICFGDPGSGKTTYAEQLLKFHNPATTLTNRNSTNISLIERISELNQKNTSFTQPAPTVLLDNLDKAIQDDFILYKDLLISTRPNESIRSISKRTYNLEGSGVYNYYAYTVGTTIFDIRPLSQTNQFYNQIVSRTIYLMFEHRSDYEDLSRYSWNNFRYVYQEFWNKEENLNKYLSIFDEMPDNHSDFGFPSRRAYDISKMGMAAGVAWGVFSDSFEALNAFSEYWKSLDYLVDVVRDPYVELVRLYVLRIHPKELEAKRQRQKLQHEKYGWDIPCDSELEDEINKKDIESYLSNKCGVRLSAYQWRVEIPILMRALGYKHDVKNEDGYIFVRR